MHIRLRSPNDEINKRKEKKKKEIVTNVYIKYTQTRYSTNTNINSKYDRFFLFSSLHRRLNLLHGGDGKERKREGERKHMKYNNLHTIPVLTHSCVRRIFVSVYFVQFFLLLHIYILVCMRRVRMYMSMVWCRR